MKSAKNSGFTLLEVMIALAIIGIAVTVILHTVNYHADILHRNTLTTEMVQLAKENLYKLEASPTSSEGRINQTDFKFENSVNISEDSKIAEIETRVLGHDMQIVLRKIIFTKGAGSSK